jgi:hypothetical protein
MQSLYNIFFKTEEAKKQCEVEDIIAKYMQDELLQQMMCFTLTECSLYQLKPSNKGCQKKDCEFMSASLNLATQQIDTDDGNKINIPVIVINNDDYDEDQD